MTAKSLISFEKPNDSDDGTGVTEDFVNTVNWNWDVKKPPKPNTLIDTWIFPLVQASMFDIRTDEMVTEEFLKRLEKNSNTYLASGYFNLTDTYMDCILNHSQGDYNILTAAPEANGFFGASGVMSGIHQAYTLIARDFYSQICCLGLEDRIRLFEYSRSRWTFHAKGLWYYPPCHNLPAITFIGSPNFGKSVNCQNFINLKMLL